MFCYQEKFDKPTQVIDSTERLTEILSAPWLKDWADNCRFKKDSGDEKGYAEYKKQLPMLCFSAASFDNHVRNQENVHLNGLAVLDIDHLEITPQECFDKHVKPYLDKRPEGARWEILYVFITPSWRGIKVVFTADPEVGNIADNQIEFSQCLGLENDKSIKNADRGQFAMPTDAVLYANYEKLVNYYDEEFDRRYSGDYRKGHSQPTKDSHRRADSDVRKPDSAGDAGDAGQNSNYTGGDLKYGDIPVGDLCARYTEAYGTPVEGDRHRTLIKVAGHLRYLVDNNQQKLKVAVRTLPWVRQWEEKEKNAREIDDIVRDACGRPMWREVPKALQSVIDGARHHANTGGAQVPAHAGEAAVRDCDQEIWDRLQPLLEDDPLNTTCVAGLPDVNKIAAVFVSAAMFDTLATRCCYKHFDGKLHRMNPNVACIGNPASGKSFANEYDDAIMAVMLAADEPGRRAEAEYKKEQRKRRTSNKAEKGEHQLKEPEECIRYIPSRTSNATFYKRLINAKELVNGEVIPMHLYTFDSELDSSVAAQAGGSWIAKHDLELKAFHNERGGVDYSNNDSVNDLIPVYWNQVLTGTQVALAKKINPSNVNDGLCSRIAFVRIASDDYAMIPKGDEKKLTKKLEEMKKWGEFFDSLKGEIYIPKLVNHCYDLCAQAAKEAEKDEDKVKDYLRKRAVFYAEWFTIPRIIARAYLEKQKGKKVDYMRPPVRKSDLEFASLVFDTVVYYQDFYFGRMLEEKWREAENAFAVRPLTRKSKNEEGFDGLPKEFDVKTVAEKLCLGKIAAQVAVSRWLKRNKIEKIKTGLWKKIA